MKWTPRTVTCTMWTIFILVIAVTFIGFFSEQTNMQEVPIVKPIE